MRAAHVYYAKKRRAASTKHMIKTCEYLGLELDLKAFSSLRDIDETVDFYGARKTFDYRRTGIRWSGNFAVELFARLLFSVLTYLGLVRGDFDAIYTSDVSFLVFLSMPFVPVNSPVVYECHNPHGDNPRLPTFLEDHALQLPGKILCVSEGVMESFQEKGIEPEKMDIQRNCVDLDYFRERIGGEAGSADDEKDTITYVGSFKLKKGVEVLLDAFEALGDRRDVELLLVGGRDGSEQTMRRIEQDKRIEYRHQVPESELPHYMSGSDVLVLPSLDTRYQRRFTCPMKLFEYMASGTPVVASDLPTTRWVAEETVYYFEPGNAESLADKLEEVLKDDDPGNKSSEALAAVQEYTWQRKAEKVAAELEELASL